jgi:serpin B
MDQRLSEQEGVVSLPRFKMNYEAELTAPLQKLGMNQMFSPNADFSNISSIKPLYVSEVLHKTTIEVNEEGTEAAAATVVQLRQERMLRKRAVSVHRRPAFYRRHLRQRDGHDSLSRRGARPAVTTRG